MYLRDLKAKKFLIYYDIINQIQRFPAKSYQLWLRYEIGLLTRTQLFKTIFCKKKNIKLRGLKAASIYRQSYRVVEELGWTLSNTRFAFKDKQESSDCFCQILICTRRIQVTLSRNSNHIIFLLSIVIVQLLHKHHGYRFC